MAAEDSPTLPAAVRAALTPRAVGASLLLFFAIVAAVIFAGFEVALAGFILSVIVAPNHWYRGAAGDQSTSMEHPGGF